MTPVLLQHRFTPIYIIKRGWPRPSQKAMSLSCNKCSLCRMISSFPWVAEHCRACFTHSEVLFGNSSHFSYHREECTSAVKQMRLKRQIEFAGITTKCQASVQNALETPRVTNCRAGLRSRSLWTTLFLWAHTCLASSHISHMLHLMFRTNSSTCEWS